MNKLYLFAAEVQEYCEAQGWEFCFIGGIAVQAWSEARVTRDADITLITGFGEEEPFIDALLSRFSPRVENAREFALRNRVLLLNSEDGIGLDISLAGMDFERSAVRRSVRYEFQAGSRLRICTPEDLLIFKVFAARALDWRDVEMLIVRQGEKNLDWNYIQKHLTPLIELKERPDILRDLERLRTRLK